MRPNLAGKTKDWRRHYASFSRTRLEQKAPEKGHIQGLRADSTEVDAALVASCATFSGLGWKLGL